MMSERVYFWTCPYIRENKNGSYQSCLLGKKEFGRCDQCQEFKDRKNVQLS